MILGAALIAARLAAAETAAPSVTLVHAERRDLRKWIKLPATVEADSEVTLFAKVSGYLKGFTIDVGDPVRPGQAIGRLDAPELEQDVKLAEAQVASAQADFQATNVQLDRLRIRGAEIDARQLGLEAELAKAKAEADRARKEYERTQKLFSTDAATDREREREEYTTKMLEAAVKVAESRLALLKPERDLWKKDLDVGRATVEAAKGKVGVAEAALGRARVWLSFTELKVPELGARKDITATVTRRFVSNGDLIAGGTGPRTGLQAILTLTVTDPVRVIAEVPENESVRLEKGAAALVSIRARPNEKPIAGRVARMSSALAPATRTLRVEIDLANPDGRIKPGMMAEVELATEVRKSVLAVPTGAVVSDKQGAWLFTIQEGKARKLTIETGLQDHGWVEVRSPALAEDAPLVGEATATLADGAPLTIKRP